MVVEKITADDINKLHELQPEGWPDIIQHFQFYVSSKFCHPIKIVTSDKIVGIGSAIFHGDSAWLGHIIVPPAFRNKGIGKVVTKTLIDIVEASKIKTISLIATDLGEPVYTKLGFEKNTDYKFYKRDEPSELPVDTKHVKDAEPEAFAEILELDRQVSGEDRSALLNPHLPAGKLYMDKFGVQGFYLPTLGEGLIEAKQAQAGLELLKFSLSTKTFYVLPTENRAATETVEYLNFKCVRSAARMSLGKRLNFRPEFLFNRIGGNLG